MNFLTYYIRCWHWRLVMQGLTYVLSTPSSSSFQIMAERKREKWEWNRESWASRQTLNRKFLRSSIKIVTKILSRWRLTILALPHGVEQSWYNVLLLGIQRFIPATQFYEMWFALMTVCFFLCTSLVNSLKLKILWHWDGKYNWGFFHRRMVVFHVLCSEACLVYLPTLPRGLTDFWRHFSSLACRNFVFSKCWGTMVSLQNLFFEFYMILMWVFFFNRHFGSC